MVELRVQRGDPAPPTVRVGPVPPGGGGRMTVTPAARAALPQRPPAPAQPPAPSPEVDPDVVTAMRDFANPSKVKPPSPSPSPGSETDGDSEFSGTDGSGGDGGGDFGPGGGGGESFDSEDDFSPDPAFAPAHVEKPSPGFLTIDDEKSDILFKLQRLKKNGVASGRHWSVQSDIRELRSELARIRTELELERSLKFSRKALVGIASAIEFFNDKVDILDLELDGWSEQMHQSVYNDHEFDDELEELFFKYRGSMKTPPEVRLMLAVGGSAFSFHMANSMFKRPAAAAELHAAAGADKPRKEMRGPPPTLAPPPPAPPAAPEAFGDQMFRVLKNPPPDKPRMPKQPKMPDFSPPPSSFPGFPEFRVPAPTRVGREPREAPPPAFPAHDDGDDGDDGDGGSERFSDIPSDLESLPSDLSLSPDYDDGPPSPSPPPKKKAKKAPAREKRVFQI